MEGGCRPLCLCQTERRNKSVVRDSLVAGDRVVGGGEASFLTLSAREARGLH